MHPKQLSSIFILYCCYWTFINAGSLVLLKNNNSEQQKPWHVSPPPEIERLYQQQLYLQRLKQYFEEQQREKSSLDRYPLADRMHNPNTTTRDNSSTLLPITTTTKAILNGTLKEASFHEEEKNNGSTKGRDLWLIFAYAMDVLLIFGLAILFRLGLIKRKSLQQHLIRRKYSTPDAAESSTSSSGSTALPVVRLSSTRTETMLPTATTLMLGK